jgi:hypothetical protein
MMMKKYFKYFILSMLFTGFTSISAQHNSTTYYMNTLPQSTLLNPANQPDCNFYLSLPGLSFDIQNSVLNFDNLYKWDPEAGKYYTPFDDSLATLADEDAFLGKFKSVNTFSTDLNVSLFGLGFSVGNDYFSFHVAQRFRSNFDYPDDLCVFLLRVMVK